MGTKMRRKRLKLVLRVVIMLHCEFPVSDSEHITIADIVSHA